MCRLAHPSPVVNKKTRPVLVLMSKPMNLERKEKADFEILEVDKALKLLIDKKIDYSKGELFKEKLNGLII